MQWTVGKMPPYAPGTWPEFLPPFLTNALFAAPGDMLWIRRAGPAEASPSFDVFGTDGVVTGRVVLPPGRDLLGVGRNGVYLIYRDEWDLQHVERYRLPRIGN
ncbi:MAG TPA: hypothetical protein VMN60_11640 [Longimicrobiales bacterium]|nr:hypothetical protein [Longimicrobiales bacterium]